MCSQRVSCRSLGVADSKISRVFVRGRKRPAGRTRGRVVLRQAPGGGEDLKSTSADFPYNVLRVAAPHCGVSGPSCVGTGADSTAAATVLTPF